jgi:hypothetical protein
MEHSIEITLSARKYATTYHGDHIGDFKQPATEAARWLKANRGAVDSDILTVCRNGRPALHGSIGWLAARTVLEGEKDSPRFAKYRPFVMAPSDRPATVCGTAPEPQVAAA